MIFLFTDFGWNGPYVGQMLAVLAARAPRIAAVPLMSDAPSFDPRAAAYLLAALANSTLAAIRAPVPATAAHGGGFPQPKPVFLCVVDPGVGTDRRPLMVETGDAWFVGPDNGLFEPVLRRSGDARAWSIDWRPPALSASFHGRDLFAPVAAHLAQGGEPPGTPVAPTRFPDWPDELAEVIYVDHYGNAMTGLRASSLRPDAALLAGGSVLPRRRTFGDAPPGTAFWYANSTGLAEIAVNRGSAAALLGLSMGDPVAVG
ncbi:MAG TPA: SAM-dependent chlorinase/fluorinase [Azospirillaceae bacterium]|nr:SAM-dependent chlorinase/fluorinase [Azospirillaceae bacterium]